MSEKYTELAEANTQLLKRIEALPTQVHYFIAVVIMAVATVVAFVAVFS